VPGPAKKGQGAAQRCHAPDYIIPTVTHLPWRAVPGNCAFLSVKRRNLPAPNAGTRVTALGIAVRW
jgi:hypothetical protein